MYRTKDWSKHLLKEIKKMPDPKLLKGDLSKALTLFAEAGADAMLEALKGKEDTVRLKLDGTSKIPAHGDYPEIIIEGKPYDKGWLIFIPEENNGDL